MKKIFLSIHLVVGFICNCSLGQMDLPHDSLAKTVIRFTVKPSTTDPAIRVSDSAHLVVYNPSIKQGQLLLFMPGTNGFPGKVEGDFFKTAIQRGYRVIILSYINTPSVSTTCTGDTLAHDANCAEEFRVKRIYGKNTTSLIPDEPQDAIMNRFVKLLIYLTKFDKPGNWGVYLENGAPKWSEIAVVGQSQGGGMAAFIAKRVLVSRVISFSGGWDRSAKNKMAGWYTQKSVTPPERWYGTYNVAEPAAATIAETYRAMNIPENHIYPLKLETRPGNKAHGEGIKNAAYKQQWIELLGVGN